MKLHYIMLKTHNTTGLKYLCYHLGTKESCFIYLGSGKYWIAHLKKHGKDVSTVILAECQSRGEAREKGLYYSEQFDIVNSDKYANLIVEDARTNWAHRNKINYNGEREFPNMKDIAAQRTLRRKLVRLTDKEKLNHQRLGSLRKSNPELMISAAKRAGETRGNRLRNKEFTEREIAKHREQGEKLRGVSIAERKGIEFWESPHKGKTMKEITQTDYQHPSQIKYNLFVNNVFYIETCITDMLKIHKLSHSYITPLRNGNEYIVKRLKSSKHQFKHGDILKLVKCE
jgi:hypothetical protein